MEILSKERIVELVRNLLYLSEFGSTASSKQPSPSEPVLQQTANKL